MKPPKLRDYLREKLPKKEWPHITTSFDIVGSIAIIEVHPELTHREAIIGEGILAAHKNITTVCKKDGEHSGIYRRQKLKIIAGERTKVTEHKESGCRLKLHVEQCYFSGRSSTERLRIAKLVSERFRKQRQVEDILVMFSGIAPFVCVIGKHAPYKTITGIEMNPVAHTYALENVILNKLMNVKLLQGDVRKIIPTINQTFDRIIMPLPRTAEEFLPTALEASHKGTIIHLYGFLPTEEFEAYKLHIKEVCQKMKYDVAIKQLVICGQFSPRLFRICVDMEII